MTKKESQQILEKLDDIQNLLIQVIPQRTELTEKDVLKIIKEGDRELAEGKTKTLHSLKDLR